VQSSAGGIYEDDNHNIQLLWWASENEQEWRLSLQLKNAKPTQRFSTDTDPDKKLVIGKDQNFRTNISFDGANCKWHVNDMQIGTPFDCLNGFGSLGTVCICHTESGGFGGWTGRITNLTFTQKKLGSEKAYGKLIIIL
jgi:hypothetical protein